LRRLGSANAQQGKRITELTQQIAQLFRSQQSDQMQPQPAAMQALPPPPVVQALPPPPVAYNTHEAQARSRAPSMEAQALSAESQLPSAFPGLFALPIRLANGTSKHWTDVKKDEKVDTATMRPSYWFECLEEKTRGGQKLTRQLLLFSDGIALVNNDKFKWYRPHMLLSKMLWGDKEADLLVLQFKVGEVGNFIADCDITARLLVNDRQQVTDALQTLRAQMQNQDPINAPHHAPIAHPPAQNPAFLQAPPLSPQPQNVAPGPPPVNMAAYEEIIKQARDMLGYDEAQVRSIASQLCSEGRPADLNVLLDRLC